MLFRRLGGLGRTGLAGLGLAVAIAGLGVAEPAAAVTPGCTVAAAAPLELGSVNTHESTCPSNYAYNYVDLGAGDVLTLDLDGRNLVASFTYVYLFNPGVTDYTIGNERWTDSVTVYRNAMTQVSWRAYETGRFTSAG